MGALVINNEIRTRFNTEWADAHPVAWPNVRFVPEVGVLWCRLTIQTLTTEILDIGAKPKTNRTPGIITIQVFAPKNEGDLQALTVASQVASIFHTWVGDTVRCREASIQTIGEDPQGDDWYQVNVTVIFEQDELI